MHQHQHQGYTPIRHALCQGTLVFTSLSLLAGTLILLPATAEASDSPTPYTGNFETFSNNSPEPIHTDIADTENEAELTHAEDNSINEAGSPTISSSDDSNALSDNANSAPSSDSPTEHGAPDSTPPDSDQSQSLNTSSDSGESSPTSSAPGTDARADNADNAQSSDENEFFNLSDLDEILPISILQQSTLTPGAGFHSARTASTESSFQCTDNSVYNMQASGAIRRINSATKTEEEPFISAPPIARKRVFTGEVKRQLNAFAINTEGTAAFVVENGNYPVPECDNSRFDAQHRSGVCATRNTETWFRILTWTKEQGWARLQIGNRSFIRQNELPGYNAYINSAGTNRKVLNQSVGAWNPRLNRYYFGFYGDRTKTQNMELYLYWISPTSGTIAGPLVVDATSLFSGDQLPKKDKFINGDIMFDTAGNLYSAMSTGKQYKLIGVNHQYVDSATNGTRLNADKLFVAKTDGALKTNNLVSGLAFRSDGAVVFNALNALEAYNPQTGLKLSAQKEGEDGTYRLSRPIPSRDNPNSVRTDMASCAQPTTLEVRKKVDSWAEAGRKDVFSLTMAYELDVNKPVERVTTTAPDGDGLGVQNGTIGPMPMYLTSADDSQGRVVLKEFLGQNGDVINDYDATWICETSKGTRLAPVSHYALDLNLKNSQLKGSAITCTVTNTKKVDNPQPFTCDTNSVYLLEDYETNRIVEVPKLGSGRQGREYVTAHIHEKRRHNAFAISGDGRHAMAIEMDIKDPHIQWMWIKKFDGRRWTLMPVDGSTRPIKVGISSYKAWQAGAINPADGKYYFGYWKPRDWGYLPYPALDKLAVFELFYYDNDIPGGAIKHVASIKTDYAPEKREYGRFLTEADEFKNEVLGINGDITFDNSGNLYILGSKGTYGQVSSVLSFQIQQAKQHATRYYHRNNNDTVGGETNFTDFYKWEKNGCHNPDGTRYDCASIRKDPTHLTQLAAQTVGSTDIHAGGGKRLDYGANGIAFRNDGSLFVSTTRFGAGYTVNPWDKVEDASTKPHPDGDYNLPVPPNGPGEFRIFGDSASCNMPMSLLIRKNLPKGRFTLTDQFELRVVENGAPDSAALTSTTRGSETGLQIEPAHAENGNYTPAEWVGSVPLIENRSYTITENLAATPGAGDSETRKRELRRKYTSHVECTLDGTSNAFDGQPMASGAHHKDGFTITVPKNEHAGKQIVCTFTNIPRPVITWDKVNEAGDLLSGSEWTITEKLTPGANSDDTKPLGGTGKVTITDCAVGSGKKCPEPAEDTLADVDPVAGKFRLEGARYGTYTLVEKTAPRGYSKLDEAAIAPLTISLPDFKANEQAATPKPLTFQTDPQVKGKVVNQKSNGALSWSKVGAGTAQRLTGSIWKLSSTQVSGFQTLTVRDCVAPNACQSTNDANPAPGEFTVENLTQGAYTLTETEAPAGYVIAVDRHGNPVTHPVVVGSDTTHIGLIENEQRPQVSIPLTGGMSADAFLIAGGTALGVSALAAIAMLRRRRVTNSPPAQQ